MQNTDKSLVIRKYWKSSLLLDFYNKKSFMEKMYLDCTMNVQKKLLGMSVTQYFNFAVRGDPLNFTDNGRHLLCSYWSAAFERFTKFGVFINPFFVINGKNAVNVNLTFRRMNFSFLIWEMGIERIKIFHVCYITLVLFGKS